MEIDTKTEVKATELAAVLGLTARRIQQLAQDSVITTVSKEKYNLSCAVQSYIMYRENDKPLSQAESEKLNADVAIKKAKAIMMAHEAQEIQGKMFRAEDIVAISQDREYAIRSMLLALPGRLAVDVAGIDDPARASERIRAEVYEVMNELARYKFDPKRCEERVKSRLNWDSISEDDDDEES